MESHNLADAQKSLLRLPKTYYQIREQKNQQTASYYNKLSSQERSKIIQWLKVNLSQIPLLPQSKKMGLEKLIARKEHCPVTLTLIRHAFNALSL